VTAKKDRLKPLVTAVGLGYLNTGLIVLVGLWFTPFLLRELGEQRYGLWLLGAQILLYLGLLDLGVVALLPREVAYATGRAGGREDASDLPLLVGQTIRLVLWQTPIVALVAAAIWLLVPDSWATLAGPLGLVVVAFVLLFPARVLQALLQGIQDLPFVGGTQLAAWFCGTGVTFLLVGQGWGLYSLSAGWIVTQGLTVAAFWRRLRVMFPETLPSSLPALSSAAVKRRLGKGLSVSVSQVAQVLLTGSDLLIIGRVMGPAFVVMYACTGKLVSILANQPAMLMQLAEPALSELRAGSSRRHAFDASTALSQAVLMGSGGIACIVLAVNHGFVEWWVGAGRFGGNQLTVLMLVSMLLRHLNVTASYTLFCFGYERQLAIVGVIDGIVTVTLSLALVPFVGPSGALFGSILGVVCVSLPANLRALGREDGVSVWTALKPLAPWLWRFVVLAALASISAVVWVPNTFLTLSITGAAVGAVYTAVMYPLLGKPPLGRYIAPRMAEWLPMLSRRGAPVVTGETAS
jgi:O-antigen/teichoic acid export membrane protein